MADLTALYREDATEEEVVEAYQFLIDTGELERPAWDGHTHRTAAELIDAGLCHARGA